MRKRSMMLLAAVFLLTTGVLQAKKHITDQEIQAEIQDRLYHASVFKHGQVQAAYDNGVVTLTGSVDSLGVKDDAARAVRKVPDVSQIVNNITINTGDITDQQIAVSARRQVILYPFFTVFDWMTFRSQNHHLKISGYVTEPYKKIDIGRLMERVKGVNALENNLTVLPTSVDDDQVRMAIARAIYTDPYFAGYGNQPLPPIHIIVNNLNVTLYGVVNSPVDRQKAEQDARFAATYFSLTDKLVVEHQ
ncbi:MAG TPA: BON domain-containing protein [Terriglobia bacterium]|nr:BON domain-containing protein [Terriglobia bacterium]